MGLDDAIVDRFSPVFVTPEARANFAGAIRALKESVNYQAANFFEQAPPGHLLQGDCSEIPATNPETGQQARLVSFVLSNSCDISPENVRLLPARLTYCPVIALTSYEALLRQSSISQQKVDGHLEALRGQKISNLIYLPDTSALGYEAIVMLDNVASVRVREIYDDVLAQRKFSLNQFGHYLLLFKMSYHFCRLGSD